MSILYTILNGAIGGVTFGMWWGVVREYQIHQFNSEYLAHCSAIKS